MNIGRMRETVSFYSPPTGRDALGQRSGSPTLEGTRAAEVQALRGREFFAAAQVQQETSIKVRIRRWDAVVPTWWLEWNGQRWDITSAIRVGQDMTEILAMQGVKDGR